MKYKIFMISIIKDNLIDSFLNKSRETKNFKELIYFCMINNDMCYMHFNLYFISYKRYIILSLILLIKTKKLNPNIV